MQEQQDPAATYNSNPFTLAFDALGRFFNTNMAWAIVIIVLGFFGFISQIAQSALEQNTRSTSPSQSMQTSNGVIESSSVNVGAVIAIAAVILVVLLVVIVIGSVIDTFIKGMFTHTALQSEQGRSVTFSEAFAAVKQRFGRLFFATLLANLKILGWTLLLIVPGIIAAMRYTLLPYLIMNESEDEKGVKDSHNKTKLLVKGRLMEVFGLGFVASIIPIVGPLLGITGNAALYRQLEHSHKHGTEMPKIHWLNYIGFIFFGLILLAVLVITAIVVAIIASK